MATLPVDPLLDGGIEAFGKDFRSGKITSVQLTEVYLERIKQLDEKLGAFEFVDTEKAMSTARAMDLLRQSGTDLGPLMGLPIAIKDVFTIAGMPPPKVGTNINFPDILGDTEGPFIQALRKAGCVFLGKTKTVEFCLGITGDSAPRGTPWNPADLENHRAPGGSSSGSAVATAAGLCAFAIGSDSGGSVRVPAAFNGVFGLKTTFGFWPVDGAFPLDPRVDSIGLLTKSAQDALVIFRAISSVLFGYKFRPSASGIRVDRLRLGVPENHFQDNVNPQIEQAFKTTNQRLQESGALLEPIVVPEAPERADYFPVSMPAALLSVLGKENFLEQKSIMDPVIAKRIESGLEAKTYDFLALEDKRTRSRMAVENRFAGFDAWVSPTTADYPPLISEFSNPDKAFKLALGMTQNTQPANYLGLCAVSIPLPTEGLPIGYQLMGAPGQDLKLLELAVEMENMLRDKSPIENRQ